MNLPGESSDDRLTIRVRVRHGGTYIGQWEYDGRLWQEVITYDAGVGWLDSRGRLLTFVPDVRMRGLLEISSDYNLVTKETRGEDDD